VERDVLKLVPFEEAARLGVEVRRYALAASGQSGPRLLVEYSVEDPEECVVWPESSTSSGQRDGLWQHTCMELFVGLDRAENYCEINASPSGEWAFYYFDAYRERKEHRGAPVVPLSIRVSGDERRRTVSFAIEIRRVHDLIGHPPWRWQPTAVLETATGLSYWASSHPGGRPDFHRLEHVPSWDPYLLEARASE